MLALDLLSASSIARKRRLGLFGHVARLADEWWCPSKPDPSDLLQSSSWCLAVCRLQACSRSTSHHLDPSDLPGHGNSGNCRSGAGRRHIVLATNRSGGMLRLNVEPQAVADSRIFVRRQPAEKIRIFDFFYFYLEKNRTHDNAKFIL